MEPNTGAAKQPTNSLLAHLNDTDEAHASTRVDFLHPGTVIHPATNQPAETPTAEAPQAPQPVPSAPKSPRNSRPIIVVIVIILLLAAAGGGAYWWFKLRKPASSPASQTTSTQTVTATPIVPTSLAQKNSAGQAVTAGGALKDPLELDFTMNTDANSGSIEPQVEVQPLGTAFTNQANYKGTTVTPSGTAIAAKVSVTDLKDGSYHWQARFAVGSETSDWVAFGTTVSSADFVIDSTVPKSAAVTIVGTKAVAAGATSFTTTENPTVLSGTAEAGDTVAVAITPDNQTATATADASGKWTVTLQQGLANGSHTVAITSTDLAGNTSNTSFSIDSNTAASAPATGKVAATGDSTRNLTLLGAALAALSIAGLILVKRRDQHQV